MHPPRRIVVSGGCIKAKDVTPVGFFSVEADLHFGKPRPVGRNPCVVHWDRGAVSHRVLLTPKPARSCGSRSPREIYRGPMICTPDSVDGSGRGCYTKMVPRVTPSLPVVTGCAAVNPILRCDAGFLAETCLRFHWSFPVGMWAEATKRSALVPELHFPVKELVWGAITVPPSFA